MMKLLSSQLFQRPSQVTETREAADGFSIRIQSCKHSLLNCTQIKTSEDVVGDVTELMGDEVFDEVRLEFVINDTRLLSASATFLTHDDLTCGVDELGPSKVIQTIEIQFRNINELKDKRIRFKPRGYKDEELILLSRLLPVNASVPDGQKVFEYFHKNDTDDYSFRMKFPENRNGKCVLTEDIHDVVRLNENSQTHCKVELVRNETSNETLCQQMQKQVSNYLFNMMNLTFNGTQVGFASNLFVSRYWSPRFDVSGWTSVIMTNVPAVSTEMKEVDSHCLCTNFFRKAKYSFYTRKVRPTKARTYENVIEGFNIDFGPSGDVKFPIEIENQTISVDVLVQIQFFHEYETALKSNANIDLISSLSLLTVTIFQTML